MSIYPTTHPSIAPSSRTSTGQTVRWTYNPDAPLGKGHGIMWDSLMGWLLWRDQPEANGDTYIRDLPVEEVPDWALWSVAQGV